MRVYVFIFGRVTLKYFFPTSLSLFSVHLSKSLAPPPRVQSAILSFCRQHSSDLIDHNMAPLPSLCCVGHFRNLSTPFFFTQDCLSLSSTKLRCCTVYKPKQVEKKKPKLVLFFSPPQFRLSHPPLLPAFLHHLFFSPFLQHSTSLQPSLPCCDN